MNSYQTEKEVLNILQKKGYWCHLFEYSSNGQPVDIIAFNDSKVMLIDVKHCDNVRFTYSRIEANQDMCMKYARSISAKVKLGFVIYFELINKFKFLEYDKININDKSVVANELLDFEYIL